MDLFGVPKKVNRHLIKALTSLSCGLSDFYVPFEHVMDEASYQMRNLMPIANERQVLRMALINLCNVGIMSYHDGYCALSQFGRIDATHKELTLTFPPKPKTPRVSKSQKQNYNNAKSKIITMQHRSENVQDTTTLGSVKKSILRKPKDVVKKLEPMKKCFIEMCPICTIMQPEKKTVTLHSFLKKPREDFPIAKNLRGQESVNSYYARCQPCQPPNLLANPCRVQQCHKSIQCAMDSDEHARQTKSTPNILPRWTTNASSANKSSCLQIITNSKSKRSTNKIAATANSVNNNISLASQSSNNSYKDHADFMKRYYYSDTSSPFYLT